MTIALADFLNTLVPDDTKGDVVFQARCGKRCVSDRLGKIRSFLRTYPDAQIQLVTDAGERFGFGHSGPAPDHMPPPTITIGESNVWLLDASVSDHDEFAKQIGLSLTEDLAPIGDIKFVGDEDNYYATKILWEGLNALRTTTVEEFLRAEKAALANGRLTAGEGFPGTYYPKADSYIDARGVKRAIVFNEAAADFAEETGLTVIAHPPWTYHPDFGPGSYLPNRIQVIVSNSRKRKFTKKIYLDENGEKKKDDYQYESQVWTFTVVVNNFEEMARAFAALLPMKNMCVLRGHCVADSWYQRNRRKKPANGKPPPSFCEAPLMWFWADIDNLEMPDGLSYDDPVRAAKYARLSLPTALHKVAMAYQFSSSAAVWSTDKLKIHCAFWLPRPISCSEIKPWVTGAHILQNNRAYVPVMDDSLFHGVQPHYTASPELKNGIEDPLEGKRVGTLEGQPFADICDEIETARNIVIKKKRRRTKRTERVSDQNNDFLQAASSMGSERRGDGKIPEKIWAKIVRDKLMAGKGGQRFYGPTLALVSSAYNRGVKLDTLKSRYIKALTDKFATLPPATQREWAGDLEYHTSDERFDSLIEYCSTQA